MSSAAALSSDVSREFNSRSSSCELVLNGPHMLCLQVQAEGVVFLHRQFEEHRSTYNGGREERRENLGRCPGLRPLDAVYPG